MDNPNQNLPQSQGVDTPPQATVTTAGSGGGNRKVLLFGIVGVLVLLGGVVAGVFLINQNQDFRSRAGDACAGIDNPSVTSSIFIPEGCSVSGVRFKGTAPSSASSDGDCVGYSENSSGFSATGPTTISLSPSCGQCEQVDFIANGGTSYGTAKYGGSCDGGGGDEPKPKACGDTCNSDSDCRNPSPAGVTVWCNPDTKICEGKFCPAGQTQPGANCQCDAGRTCGQSCGASVGLCEDGQSQCGFITNPNQCLGAEGDATRQFCIPDDPQQGYSFARCDGIAARYLIGPNGETGLTQEDVIAACNPAPPTASPTPEPTEPPAISAQCLNIRVFDTEWNELNQADMQNLGPGDVIRVAVAGSANSGSFVGARFTINGVLRAEVAQQVLGGDEFYDEYTIPENASGLSISAEVRHSELGWF